MSAGSAVEDPGLCPWAEGGGQGHLVSNRVAPSPTLGQNLDRAGPVQAAFNPLNEFPELLS